MLRHLAKLKEDINVKEQHLAELQRTDTELAKTYEWKLNEMTERIQTTETERDQKLAEMNSKHQKELNYKIRSVREEFEKRIQELMEEQRRLKDQPKDQQQSNVEAVLAGPALPNEVELVEANEVDDQVLPEVCECFNKQKTMGKKTADT